MHETTGKYNKPTRKEKSEIPAKTITVNITNRSHSTPPNIVKCRVGISAELSFKESSAKE